MSASEWRAYVTDNQEPEHPNMLVVRIGGMHCVNCPGLVEDRLMAVPGVRRVKVSYPSGRVVITHDGQPDIPALQRAVQADGYRLRSIERGQVDRESALHRFLEIGAAFILLIGMALILHRFQLLPSGLSVSDEMNYGLVFIIGLVASVSSCLAVTGGLLIALAAKFNEANPQLSARARGLPHIWFNAGRLVAYPLFGGLIGALGSALTLSPTVNGVLTLAASAIMIALGLSMLGMFPPVQHLLPRLPHSLSQRLQDTASRETRSAAFLLGSTTFFLPCGFTQALQLYVLSKADVTTGALTMLVFALGTLPALLSLSVISSLAKGAFQRHFIRFAGAGVILLGILNVQYGLVLTGSGMSAGGRSPANAVAVDNGTTSAGERQQISMKIVGFDYRPNRFTVRQGMPVTWVVDGSQAEGCGRMLLAPGLGIRKLLAENSTTIITFTPDRTGEFAFNCGMGMMTPDSKITVLPNSRG